jgi:hypothetical protein
MPGTRTVAPAAGSRPERRRVSFAASAGAAILLNGVALAVFATAAEPWQGAGAPARRIAWITSIDGAAGSATPNPASLNVPVTTRAISRGAIPVVAKAGAAARPPRQTTAAAKPSTEPAGLPPPATLPTPTASDDPPPFATVRFYESAEVEQPAEPDSDWNLDPALLDISGVQTLVFDVFIGPTGDVVGCTILAPAELAPDVRQTIEDRLRQTVARPALREGQAVASVRRIEVTIAPAGS